jgi:hypothetical protein
MSVTLSRLWVLTKQLASQLGLQERSQLAKQVRLHESLPQVPSHELATQVVEQDD